MPPTDAHVYDDDTLLARARDGDGEAFAELVRRHQRAALRVAAVVSGSTADAGDIVQDAFVSAHAALAWMLPGERPDWLGEVIRLEPLP
jgi:DNA-directed RNA polymerase specialized sigma24 family protein